MSWPTGHTVSLRCPCGTEATYEDISGFQIGAWITEWNQTHAPCRAASITPPIESTGQTSETKEGSNGDE